MARAHRNLPLAEAPHLDRVRIQRIEVSGREPTSDGWSRPAVDGKRRLHGWNRFRAASSDRSPVAIPRVPVRELRLRRAGHTRRSRAGYRHSSAAADPHRDAMIWVTHDLKEYDRGEPGGPVELVRMLCFEFDDGSGGSEWPVDPGWQPPR